MKNMSISPTLIVADDEPMMRQILSQTLTDQGFTVLMAENGTEAFALMQSARVDLVVTDLNMPKSGGLSLLKSLRESNYRETPVIIMTGNAENLSDQDLYGATVLYKPFRRQELVELIRSLLKIEDGSKV